jgi:hypothetical protein
MRRTLLRLGLRDLHGLEVLALAALGFDLPDDGREVGVVLSIASAGVPG